MSSHVNTVYQALSDTWKSNGLRKQVFFFLTTLKLFLTNLLKKNVLAVGSLFIQ